MMLLTITKPVWNVFRVKWTWRNMDLKEVLKLNPSESPLI